jgi:hypothetical protein
MGLTLVAIPSDTDKLSNWLKRWHLDAVACVSIYSLFHPIHFKMNSILQRLQDAIVERLDDEFRALGNAYFMGAV